MGAAGWPREVEEEHRRGCLRAMRAALGLQGGRETNGQDPPATGRSPEERGGERGGAQRRCVVVFNLFALVGEWHRAGRFLVNRCLPGAE